MGFVEWMSGHGCYRRIQLMGGVRPSHPAFHSQKKAGGTVPTLGLPTRSVHQSLLSEVTLTGEAIAVQNFIKRDSSYFAVTRVIIL
jgi:hypothetical protein